MPSITSGKVLVTGANGFIATWIVKFLLEAGFVVRGTVRSENKATHLRELFKSFGDKLEIGIVSDMTKESAFAEHVKGVDAIMHTASPVLFDAVEPDDFIKPALDGTLAVIKATAAHGSSVKRVIILSSVAAVHGTTPTAKLLTETDWNEESVGEVETKGKDALSMVMYRASKTLAERAAWSWYEEHKTEVGWDLVTINPTMVYGPVLHEVDRSSPERLNMTMALWYQNVIGGKLDNNELVNQGASYVDVRDAANAHLLALREPAAGDQRFIVSAALYRWQDFVSAAHRILSKLPAGDTSYDASKIEHHTRYDNSKGIKVLGMKYRTLDETTKDILDNLSNFGWL